MYVTERSKEKERVKIIKSNIRIPGKVREEKSERKRREMREKTIAEKEKRN